MSIFKRKKSNAKKKTKKQNQNSTFNEPIPTTLIGGARRISPSKEKDQSYMTPDVATPAARPHSPDETTGNDSGDDK